MTQETNQIIIQLEIERSVADKAIRNTGPILWNSIDKSIKNVISTKHFRKIV